VFIILLTIDLLNSDFIDEKEEDRKIAEDIGQMVIDHLDENYFTPEEQKRNCNVAKIPIHGVLIDYIGYDSLSDSGYPMYDEVASEDIISKIKKAENNEQIKAIIMEVDSVGGYPPAAEEIYDAIRRAQKPVVTYIRGSGVSASYWAIASSDYIIALSSADVGSIGVSGSYVDNARKNLKEGFTFHELSTGKFKDLGNPDKPLTKEEKKLIMRDLNIVKDIFIDDVSAGRKIDRQELVKIADGSSMTGKMAVQYKLIDQTGTIYDVEEYIEKLIKQEVKICEDDSWF
jgi:protease-4